MKLDIANAFSYFCSGQLLRGAPEDSVRVLMRPNARSRGDIQLTV